MKEIMITISIIVILYFTIELLVPVFCYLIIFIVKKIVYLITLLVPRKYLLKFCDAVDETWFKREQKINEIIGE